ncbi:MAG: putative amino-acid metabolite efflux pump [Chlamydiia bacterium]|nr:putative amino-acid metabolite efflux pump [Chlamydiia bacterium]
MKSKNVLLLIILALCWGPSFFFIKIILEEVPTFMLVNCRLGIAAIILIIIVKCQGKRLLTWIHLWKQFLVMGISACALPFVLITYSETMIESSLAGIINGSSPIFTAILAHYFLESEKMNVKKIIGILLGFLGIISAFLPSLLEGQHANVLGIICVAIASISYAVGMVFSRKYLMALPNLIGPTYQLIMGSLVLLPFTFIIDKPFSIPFLSAKVIISLISLAVLGTVLAFVLYYAIVKKVGATYLSTSTLLFPFVSIFLGVIFLHETLHWNAYLGCFLIVLGLITANSLINFKDILGLFKMKKMQ